MKSRALALAALFLLAGCGGGGGGSSPTANVPTAPTTAPTSTPVNPMANLTLSFPLGAKKSSNLRHPDYVSPNSAKIVVQVNTVNGGAPPSWVPASTTTNLVFPPTGGSNCTVSGGTATCTIPVAAPPGSVNYTFTVEDSSNNQLATLTTTQSITQGVNNTITVTLKGIVNQVSVTGATLTADTPTTGAGETLTVTPLDASGAQIVGSAAFNSSFTLTDGDATGQTKLSVNGGAASSTVTVTSPSDVVTLQYTGQADNNVTISSSVAGGGFVSVTDNDVVLAGTTLDDAAHGGINTDSNWGQQTLFFSAASGSQLVSASELGWTDAPFSKQFDLVLSGGCTGKASASAGPATSFTITALAVGVCSARFEEHGTGYPIVNHPAPTSGNPTQNGTFWISITTAGFTVN
ncbi:MAG: hypothetical protein JO225_14680 [Candidatus Eremiobacteraeota bacterium]|nr:hypothetical protein [Candidatus Eremiobacteraeota bacterium]